MFFFAIVSSILIIIFYLFSKFDTFTCPKAHFIKMQQNIPGVMEAAAQQALAAQALFLQRLQYHLPPGIPLNVALADALGLSKSVAYKKINGESPLSTAQ